MYSKQEASLTQKRFWTSFGQYMRPVTGANGDTVNWLNYHTGVKHIYFRMDAEKNRASVAIELRHKDETIQKKYFEQLEQLKKILEERTGEPWDWQLFQHDEDGSVVSRIGKTISGVNVFNEADWPAIISFLKPRIIALDDFWTMVKEGLE